MDRFLKLAAVPALFGLVAMLAWHIFLKPPPGPPLRYLDLPVKVPKKELRWGDPVPTDAHRCNDLPHEISFVSSIRMVRVDAQQSEYGFPALPVTVDPGCSRIVRPGAVTVPDQAPPGIYRLRGTVSIGDHYVAWYSEDFSVLPRP